MSWLKKFWRGEAPFWQTFWIGLAVIFTATFSLGVYVGKNIEAGNMSFEDFYDISGGFQVLMLLFSAVWLLIVVRGMDKAVLRWSAWLAVVFIIYLIGTSTYNLTLHVLRGGASPAVYMQGDFADDEGV